MLFCLNRTMLRVKELESKLELEQTTRSRIDVQCARYKESFEKAQSELQHTKTKELTIQDSSKKTQRSLRFVFEHLNCSFYVKIFRLQRGTRTTSSGRQS